MPRVSEVIEELERVRFDPGYLALLEDVAGRLRSAEDAHLAVGPVLRFIERHPDEDLGAPGPLVHFVEQFYRRGYEDQLVESVQRQPTELNLWMLNRLINGSEGDERERYIDLMQQIADDFKRTRKIRELAAEFLK
jgi:hypothetical protein